MGRRAVPFQGQVLRVSVSAGRDSRGRRINGRASSASPARSTKQGRIQKINVIPKPYQKPHPPLFQAFSISEETVRWCAREGITPTILISQPPLLRKLVEAYQEEGRKAGRTLKLGENIGVLRAVYLGGQSCAGGEAGPGRSVGNRLPRILLSFRFLRSLARAWQTTPSTARRCCPSEEATIARMERATSLIWAPSRTCGGGWTRWSRMPIRNGLSGRATRELLPLAEAKRQVEVFGKELLPRYK